MKLTFLFVMAVGSISLTVAQEKPTGKPEDNSMAKSTSKLPTRKLRKSTCCGQREVVMA